MTPPLHWLLHVNGVHVLSEMVISFSVSKDTLLQLYEVKTMSNTLFRSEQAAAHSSLASFPNSMLHFRSQQGRLRSNDRTKESVDRHDD